MSTQIITVISGTNRQQSNAAVFAGVAVKFLEAAGQRVNFLDLYHLNPAVCHPLMFEDEMVHPQIAEYTQKFILPAEKFYFVIPEYNGSFPGLLKVFIDACSVLDQYGGFSNKKSALLGIASGRAGNLRGMDHFAAILNYMNVHVMPNKQPVSRVQTLVDAQQRVIHQPTLNVIEQHLHEFIQF